MNYNVNIFQIDTNKASEKLFQPFNGEPIRMSDYKKVYTYTHKSNVRDEQKVLNEVYQMFNISHPEDFKGHSLSVSDIVQINGTPYYVDDYGFKKIDDVC